MPDPIVRKQSPPLSPDIQSAPMPAGAQEVDYPAGAQEVDYEAIGKGEPSNLEKLGRGMVDSGADFFRGAGAGAIGTGVGAYKLARKVPGVGGILPPPSPAVERLTQPPPSLPGKIGYGAEQVAEFALPGQGVVEGGVNLARKGLSRLGPAAEKLGVGATRAGIDAAQTGGVRALQTGGDPKETAEAAALGGGLSAAGSFLGEALPAIKRSLSGPRQDTFVARMMQGLRPGSTQVEFANTLHRAGPLIKQEESLLGTEIGKGIDKTLPPSSTQGIDDLLALTKSAKQRVWGQYEQMLRPRANLAIDLNPVADAMETSIPKKLRFEATRDPTKQAILDRMTAEANVYRRSVPLKDAEDFLHTANAELATYESKYPAMQRNALKSNPDTAATVAQADTLRDTIYKALATGDDGGEAARELKRQYGALMDLENTAMRQKVRVSRDTATEPFNTYDAAGKIVRGAAAGAVVGSLIGHPIAGSGVGAAEGVREATAPMVKKWLGDSRSSNNLIIKAFKNYEGRSVPLVSKDDIVEARFGANKRLPPASSQIGVSGVTIPDIAGRGRGSVPPGRLIAAPEQTTAVNAQVERGTGGGIPQPPIPDPLDSKVRVTTGPTIQNPRRQLGPGAIPQPPVPDPLDAKVRVTTGPTIQNPRRQLGPGAIPQPPVPDPLDAKVRVTTGPIPGPQSAPNPLRQLEGGPQPPVQRQGGKALPVQPLIEQSGKPGTIRARKVVGDKGQEVWTQEQDPLGIR